MSPGLAGPPRPPRHLLMALVALIAVTWACTPSSSRTAQPTPRTSSGPPARADLPNDSPAPTPTPTINGLEAIQRLDSRTGFVAVGYGLGVRVLKTADNGRSWSEISIPATSITTLRFIDASNGWVGVVEPVGGNDCLATGAMGPVCRAALLHTSDGGRTWQEAISATWSGTTPSVIRMVQAIDGDRAWVVVPTPGGSCPSACEADLLVTSDGGRTWKPLLHGNIAAIRFATYDRGWIVTTPDRGVARVQMTSDGGLTWTAPFTTTESDRVNLDAASPLVAWYMTGSYAVCTASSCSNYSLFRTVNGGMTWELLGNPRTMACGTGQLGAPLFASNSTGWLTLNTGAGGAGPPGGVMTTNDGGRTWRCTNQPANTGPMSAADPRELWVGARAPGGPVQSDLYSSEDGGATWARLDYSAALTH